jgi:hypothetical protein
MEAFMEGLRERSKRTVLRRLKTGYLFLPINH